MRRLTDLAELPTWAPEFAKNVWHLARAGVEVSIEDEALALAELDHPDFALLWDREEQLPDQFRVKGSSPTFHVQMHQVIETQLLQNDPPGVRPAMAHLLELGCDRHTAIHLIMNGLLKDLHTGLRDRRPPEYNTFLDRMRLVRLAGAAGEVKTGRNDPCPCGSGRKFKKCCGAGGTSPTVDPRSARMVLGEGWYAGPDALDLPQDHPLITLENLAAIARALEEAGEDAVARESYQRLVAAAEAAGEGPLNNALQDQMEFAMNHPEYNADGIAAATRLMALPFNRENQAMLRVDLADFYDTAGDHERAEALYRETLGQDPKEPYVYLRWARRLAERGRSEEAVVAYQVVIDRQGMGDPHALREARQELAELRRP